MSNGILDDVTQDYVFKFFSILTKEELMLVLEGFYDSSKVPVTSGEILEDDYEDSLKWGMHFADESLLNEVLKRLHTKYPELAPKII